MEFMLNWTPKPNAEQISYADSVLLAGSCFTEHIGNSLAGFKFSTLQNPNGILFDTLSVCRSLEACMDNRPVEEEQFFELNETWHHWQYHSRFSHPQREDAVLLMNNSRATAYDFLQQAGWLILTLGSSFVYKLTPLAEAAGAGRAGTLVANCHKAPAQWFEKHMATVADQVAALEQLVRRLRQFNPGIRILFTVSPVRHIRDGVVENNRSKARLIEAVHHITQHAPSVYYFPAYELVIDILRDYRFYDIDFVHPNYMATSFVLEQFISSFITADAAAVIEQLKPIITARKHRVMSPGSAGHQKFMLLHLEKTRQLQQRYPFLDLAEELAYFSNIII